MAFRKTDSYLKESKCCRSTAANSVDENDWTTAHTRSKPDLKVILRQLSDQLLEENRRLRKLLDEVLNKKGYFHSQLTEAVKQVKYGALRNSLAESLNCKAHKQNKPVNAKRELKKKCRRSAPHSQH